MKNVRKSQAAADLQRRSTDTTLKYCYRERERERLKMSRKLRVTLNYLVILCQPLTSARSSCLDLKTKNEHLVLIPLHQKSARQVVKIFHLCQPNLSAGQTHGKIGNEVVLSFTTAVADHNTPTSSFRVKRCLNGFSHCANLVYLHQGYIQMAKNIIRVMHLPITSHQIYQIGK